MELDTIYHGDALEILKQFPDNSVDSLICDPPAGISFMSVSFDADRGGRKQWVAWLESIMREAYRVLKDGGHGFVWALPRTSHWTMCAIEDSGFTIKDVVSHVFLQGMPKSHNISLNIDKQKGATRVVLSSHQTKDIRRNVEEDRKLGLVSGQPKFGTGSPTVMMEYQVTAPATDEAKQWDGWGSQLKPCTEFWILVQKPIAEKTIVQQVLKTGTGALNINASRVGTAQRWPAQLLLSHAKGCVQAGIATIKASVGFHGHTGPKTVNDYGTFKEQRSPLRGDADGKETVAVWQCAEGCPIALLDGQSGTLTSGTSDGFVGPFQAAVYGKYAHNQINPATVYGDSGGASRVFTQFPYEKVPPFIYLPKASPSDRTMGKLVKNTHPCIKSTHLMKYLITLTTQPGGIVLDPFCGSGSTLVAAAKSGFRFIGIEENLEFVEISRARLATLPTQQSQQPA